MTIEQAESLPRKESMRARFRMHYCDEYRYRHGGGDYRQAERILLGKLRQTENSSYVVDTFKAIHHSRRTCRWLSAYTTSQIIRMFDLQFDTDNNTYKGIYHYPSRQAKKEVPTTIRIQIDPLNSFVMSSTGILYKVSFTQAQFDLATTKGRKLWDNPWYDYDARDNGYAIRSHETLYYRQPTISPYSGEIVRFEQRIVPSIKTCNAKEIAEWKNLVC